MYYNARKKFRIISLICILVILWCVAFVIDYLKVSGGSSPIFIIKTVEHENGAKEMYGVLYKVNMYVNSGKTEYEIGFLNLEYDEDKLINIYVEPYKEFESMLQN